MCLYVRCVLTCPAAREKVELKQVHIPGYPPKQFDLSKQRLVGLLKQKLPGEALVNKVLMKRCRKQPQCKVSRAISRRCCTFLCRDAVADWSGYYQSLLAWPTRKRFLLLEWIFSLRLSNQPIGSWFFVWPNIPNNGSLKKGNLFETSH